MNPRKPATTNLDTLPGYAVRLREAQEAIGLSGSKLASSIGMKHPSTWNRWIHAAFNQPPDDTCLLALEYVHGIRKDWVLTGEGPMFSPIRKLRSVVATMEGVIPMSCPAKMGMEPSFHPGDLLLVDPTNRALVEETMVVASGQPLGDGEFLPLGQVLIGRVVGSGGNWLLYRDQDRDRLGSFPPLPLTEAMVWGRIVGRLQVFQAATVNVEGQAVHAHR